MCRTSLGQVGFTPDVLYPQFIETQFRSVDLRKIGLPNGSADEHMRGMRIFFAEYPISITNGTFAWGTGADDLTILDQ